MRKHSNFPGTDAMNLISTTSLFNQHDAGHNAGLREWAFCAGIRLSDQSKPLLCKLMVEAVIAGQELLRWKERSRRITLQ